MSEHTGNTPENRASEPSRSASRARDAAPTYRKRPKGAAARQRTASNSGSMPKTRQKSASGSGPMARTAKTPSASTPATSREEHRALLSGRIPRIEQQTAVHGPDPASEQAAALSGGMPRVEQAPASLSGRIPAADTLDLHASGALPSADDLVPELPGPDAGDAAAVPPAQVEPTARMARQGSRPQQHAKGKKSKKAAKGKQPKPMAPSSRTESSGSAFRRFYGRHLAVMIPITLVLAVIVLGGLFDLGSSFGKIHPGVKVQGVDVGGMKTDEAAAVLEEQLGPYLDDARAYVYDDVSTATDDGISLLTTGTLVGEDQGSNASIDTDWDGVTDKWSIVPSTVGAYVDGSTLASEAYLIGRQGNFILERMKAWTGAYDLDADLAFDPELLGALTSGINESIGTEIVDYRIGIADGGAVVEEGNDGWLVQEGALTHEVSQRFLRHDNKSILAPMASESVRITADDAQRVADQVNAAVAPGLSVHYEDQTWDLDAAKLSSLISCTILKPGEVLVIGDGEQSVKPTSDAVTAVYDTSVGTNPDSGWILQAFVDQKKADSYLKEVLGDAATGGAKSAYFDTSSGSVEIVPSVNGEGPDRAAAELQMQNMLFGDDEGRSITMMNTVIEPALTTEEAEAMGITEQLATWSIPLSGSEGRINNIETLCDLIDYSIIAPGEVWSFNGTTGERTEAKGFKTAPVIIDGRHEDQLGGGICQVATCVYNAVCFSGLGIETRSNHTTYIPAYDDYGFADATVSWEEPDFAWVNDMDTHILLTADTSTGSVVVTLWGTKDGREVTCERGEWTKGAKFKTITENDPTKPKGTREVTQSGIDGRSIYIQYTVVKDGKTIHDISFHSVYQAQDEIITVGTK